MRAKSILAVLMIAAVFMLTAQTAEAVTCISAQNAYDNARAGIGVVIDVRSVEEHNGCVPNWTVPPANCGSVCGSACTEPANAGSPQWIDTASGVMMQSPNAPFWLGSTASGTQPEIAAVYQGSVQALVDAQLIDFNTPIYLLCRSGYRSYYGGVYLEGLPTPYTNVYTIDGPGLASGCPAGGSGSGGMLEWTGAGLPVHGYQANDRAGHGPQIYSGSPVDGYTETTSNLVSFETGILEPMWGSAGWDYPIVARTSLYIDGVEVAFSTFDPVINSGGQLYTFSDISLANGTYIWTTRSETDVTGFSGVQVNWSPYADDPGPDDRTLIVNVVAACVDNDNDGYGNPGDASCPNGAATDCDDTNPAINPGATEVCDNIDNDCDGIVDGITQSTTCGVGQCAGNTGVETCTAGVWGGDTCDPLAGATAEVCDGLDNDCDGTVDDGIAATPTTCGIGECASTGLLECISGTLVDSCTPGEPGLELIDDVTCADGLDNDCDGLIDDEDPDCTPDIVTYYCDNDGDSYISSSISGTCTGVGCEPAGCVLTSGNDCDDANSAINPGADDSQCDGVDNDCDGIADDGYVTTPTSCGVGECASTGQISCINGAEVDTCTAGTPSAEICDGLDNDCNGIVDDGIAATPTTCGVGVCASTGLLECVNGTPVDSCTPGTPTEDPEATCDDGLDNDCDGLTDTTDPDCGGGGVTYTITATAGNGGNISPSGAVIVDAGSNQTFTITPNRGYQIRDVVVDGASVGAVTTYTFTNVSSDHTISASFRQASMRRRGGFRTF